MDASSSSKTEERGRWSSRTEFVLSCVGMSVGIANVWRFPYVAYENGGGTFQLPYVVLLLLIGVPLYLMEISRGQFAQKGPIAVWNSCPVAIGVGWGMIVICLIGAAYYAILLSYTLVYMAASFSAALPWSECAEWWGADGKCVVRTATTAAAVHNCTGIAITGTNSSSVVVSDVSISSTGSSIGNETFEHCQQHHHQETAAQQFWEKFVLNIDASSGMDSLGPIQWRLVVALIVTWLCVFACVFKGIKSVGKAVYFTATFPYVILIALLIQGAMLDGAKEGIIFFFTPDWAKLIDINVWMNAARQMVYSLGLANGALITLASYNRFNNRCHVDAAAVTGLDFLTSLIASVVIFSVLGSLSQSLGVSIRSVFAGGQGLAFIVFPEFVTHLPLPQLWCFLFFFMLFLLGIDSEFSMFESMWTAVFDRYPHLRRYQTRLYFLSIVGFILLGLPFTTAGGQYLLSLIDNYNTMCRTLLVAFETIAIMWIYGLTEFCDDFEQMLKFRPNLYLRVTWKVICPALTLGLTLVSWINFAPPTYGTYVYPSWALFMGWFVMLLCLLQIPGWALYVLFRHWQQKDWRASFRPTSEWRKTNAEADQTEMQEML